MTIVTRLAIFAGAFTAALLAVFLMDGAPFREAAPTAVAALALFCSLPLVDSALMGRSVHPSLGGAALGWSLGFFLRQSQISQALASGADRVVAVAFCGALVLGVVRWRRSRRQRA